MLIVDNSIDHDKLHLDFFLPHGMNVKENDFFRAQAEKALGDTLTRAVWYGLLSTTANCGKI